MSLIDDFQGHNSWVKSSLRIAVHRTENKDGFYVPWMFRIHLAPAEVVLQCFRPWQHANRV